MPDGMDRVVVRARRSGYEKFDHNATRSYKIKMAADANVYTLLSSHDNNAKVELGKKLVCAIIKTAKLY